jgi:chlorite dismutase
VAWNSLSSRFVEMNPRLFTFTGGDSGLWTVTYFQPVVGEPLPEIKRIDITSGISVASSKGPKWTLRGIVSNERYVTRIEKDQLVAKQAAPGRSGSTHAGLIPIRKNAAWWALTQDERRAIFEERSHHVQAGLKYLPNVARRLHHCRDLGDNEPFDFITFFDFCSSDASAFEDLVAELRATEEWKFVDREIDIRLVRQD